MWLLWVIPAFLALLLFAQISRVLLDNPRGDPVTGLFYHFARLYSRVVHRLTVRGGEHIPRSRNPGPLIVVSNHTAGVDPVLIQAACPFEVRWVMAADMRHPAGERLWRWTNVIFVEREGGDVSGAREAIRHVKAGGVLGIFPEGGIERPARSLLPFQPGVGFIIRRTGAPVLPVIIEGTPAAKSAFSSLLHPSRATVTFREPIRYGRGEPGEIADDLRDRFAQWTGWPKLDTKPDPD